jgi:LacI family transcriptional regulator
MLVGYKDALQQHRLLLNKELIYKVDGYQSQHGYDLAEKILSQGTGRPRALFVTSDPLAYGIIKRFREAGVSVPEDIAIIGFDDNFNQEYIPTELTSVKNPGYEKGQDAARLLLEQIDNPKSIDHPQTIMAEPTITIRKSCGC